MEHLAGGGVSPIVARPANPVTSLLATLAGSVVYVPNTDNCSTNRKLWDAYSAEWSSKPEWLQEMAHDVSTEAGNLKLIGEEWSKDGDLADILAKYVAPFLAPNSRVLEIGSGGGRVTTRLLPLLPEGRVTCADVSPGMLAACRAAVEGRLGKDQQQVSFLHIPPGPEAGMDLSGLDGAGPWDFILCFDVLVHCGLKQTWTYLERWGKGGQGEGRRPWLAPGGRAFFSTSNLLAPLGWQRFESQRRETVGGFVWTSPDAVDALVRQAGLDTVRKSWPQQQPSDNMYENRDYLLVVGRNSSADEAGASGS